jgi:hypothetical protein
VGGLNGLAFGSFNSGGTVPRYLELDAAASLDLVAGESRAMFTVFRNDDANSQGSPHSFGSTRYGHRILSDSMRTTIEGGLRTTEAAPFMNGAFDGAAILVHDGVSQGFEHQVTGGTGVQVGTEVASSLADQGIFLGAGTGGADEMDGAIYAAAFFSAPTIAGVPSMASLRAYLETRYGITF